MEVEVKISLQPNYAQTSPTNTPTYNKCYSSVINIIYNSIKCAVSKYFFCSCHFIKKKFTFRGSQKNPKYLHEE
jgi:hypothetical protein